MIKKTNGFAARLCWPLCGFAAIAATLAAISPRVCAGEDVAYEGSFWTATPPNTYPNANGNPSSVFVTDSFIFVLETYTHRIAVYSRETHDLVRYFGATNTSSDGQSYTNASQWAQGTGYGGFKFPQGMALDAFSGQNRFAVADTKNNRVQLFSFDADTGEIEFVSALGIRSAPGTGAADGTFAEPLSVAFTDDGRILVADTSHYRVVRLSCDVLSGEMAWVDSFQFSETDTIAGLCWDKNRGGFWVANSGNGQCVSLYPTNSFSANAPAVTFGGLSNPNDVQIWTVDGADCVAVVEKRRFRVRILSAGSGASASLTSVADVGAASGKDTMGLHWPEGAFPVDGTNLIYVADTGHNRIVWYGVDIQETPEPSEEYETVGWRISSIDISADGATTTLGWTVPTENLPSDGRDLEFVIGYRPSLTSGAWNWSVVPSNTNYVEQTAVSGTAEIDISASPFSDNPDSAFFTLEWTNKVKE